MLFDSDVVVKSVKSKPLDGVLLLMLRTLPTSGAELLSDDTVCTASLMRSGEIGTAEGGHAGAECL